MSSKFHALALAGILILGFAFRVGVDAQFRRHSPFYYQPIIDEWEYHVNARRILDGDIARGDMAFKPPLYSWFLAGLYRVFGVSIPAAKAANYLLGTATLLCLALLTLRLFGPAASLIAAGAAALYWPMVYHETQLLSEPLFGFLLMLALLLSFRSWFMLGGVVLGLAVLTRPNPLILLPVFLFSAWTFRRRLLEPALFLAAFCLPLVPFGIMARQATGEWIIWGANGGINFFTGNGAGASGLAPVPTGPKWERLIRQPEEAGVTGLKGQSSYWVRRTAGDILSAPGRSAGLQVRKLLMLFGSGEVSNNKDMDGERGYSSLLSLPFLPGFWLAGPFILLALVFGRRLHPAAWWMCLLYAAGIAAFFISSRYRQPFVLLALPLAAGAACRLPLWRRPAVPAALIAACLLVWIPWIRYDPADHLENDYNYGLVHMNLGEEDKAERYFIKALKREPAFAQCHDQLGLIALHRDIPEAALFHFKRAVEIEPDYPQAWNNLGILYIRMGRAGEAGGAFRAALRADPLNRDALQNYQRWRASAHPKVDTPSPIR